MDKLINLLKKYREQISYLFFGGLTTLISWGVSNALFYFAFEQTNNLLSNLIAEIIAITFAYVTNKIFVFRSKTESFKAFLVELLSFYLLRALSTLLNLGAMYLFVDVLSFEFWVCKIIVNVVVIIANYFFSKLFVFKKQKNRAE